MIGVPTWSSMAENDCQTILLSNLADIISEPNFGVKGGCASEFCLGRNRHGQTHRSAPMPSTDAEMKKMW